LADLFSNAALFALIAAFCSGQLRHYALYAAVVVYKTSVDTWLLSHVRGQALPLHYLPCFALRDLLQPWLWLNALVSRTTEWRGQRFRLTRGSQLIALPSAEPQLSALDPSSGPNHAPPPVEHQG
jgi:hypothetical protein